MVSDNEVRFCPNTDVETDNTITNGCFTVTEHCVTEGEDHNISDGAQYWLGADDTDTFNFKADRSGSEEVADWWKQRIRASETTFNHEPDKLNFAVKGTLKLWAKGSPHKEGQTLEFPNTFIAQGHVGTTNNWWFGITGATQAQNERDNNILAPDSTGNFTIEFQRGSNSDDEVSAVL